jgi:hypothetical protein
MGSREAASIRAVQLRLLITLKLQVEFMCGETVREKPGGKLKVQQVTGRKRGSIQWHSDGSDTPTWRTR